MKSSKEWALLLKVGGLEQDVQDPLITVLDKTGGWNGKNLDEPIAKSEFYRRIADSNIRLNKPNVNKFFEIEV